MLKYRYKQLPGVVPEKNVFLEISQNSKENTCARVVFFNKSYRPEAFFREFCEISKNIFCYGTPPVAASEDIYFLRLL